jgi:uncharacterized protein (DUF362 family)/Pyruvate/2-oxoacid:ferredoxin oxidoreductase delta subunit
MSKVSIVKCSDYDTKKVEEAVFRSVELLGGSETFIKKGDTVLIKPNLLSARPPEDAVCTHPEVVRAAIRLVKKIGATPIIGDSPGTFLGTNEIDDVYDKAGIKRVAIEEGAELVRFEKSRMVKGYPIAERVLDASFLLSLPKLKTHVFTVMTGAVKNAFGMVPGLFKSHCHKKSPQPKNFAKILLDVYEIVTPGLSIMDGIVAMDGEGPSAGCAVKTGLIAAGADGVSLDAVIAEIAGVPPSKNIIVNEARMRKIGEGDIHKIEVLGESIEAVKFKRFRLPVTGGVVSALPDFMMDFMRGALVFRPVIDEKICVKCAICKNTCPVGAIIINESRSRIDDRICISCFCCHEMCPYKAIYIKKGLLTRLFWRK